MASTSQAEATERQKSKRTQRPRGQVGLDRRRVVPVTVEAEDVRNEPESVVAERLVELELVGGDVAP